MPSALAIPGRYLALAYEDTSFRCVQAEVAAGNPGDVAILSDEQWPLLPSITRELTLDDQAELEKVPEIVREHLRGIRAYLKKSGFGNLSDIQGIGISSPGIIDSAQKWLVDLSWSYWSRGPDAKSLCLIPFKKTLGYQGKIVVDNDAVMSALGEWWNVQTSNEGRPVPDFAYIRVGNGMNGTIFINGRPLRGHLHSEMGHFVMAPHQKDELEDKFFCVMHRKTGGCLEGRVSSLRLPLLRNAIELEKRREMNAYKAKKAADSIIEEITAFYIAQLCHAITVIAAPPKIILSGRTIVASANIVDRVREEFAQLLGSYPPKNFRPSEQDYIAVAALRVEEASWQGALFAAIDPTHPQNLAAG